MITTLSSEPVGHAHAGIAHRGAAGFHVASEAPGEAIVRVAGDDEVVPVSGGAQIPVEFTGAAGRGHFDIPRRAGAAETGAREEARRIETETRREEVGSRAETRHLAKAHRLKAGKRTEARKLRLQRG